MTKRLIIISSTVLILIALPIAIYLVQQRQILRSRAAGTGVTKVKLFLELVNADNSFIPQDQEFQVRLKIGAQGQGNQPAKISGVDIPIMFNTSKLEVRQFTAPAFSNNSAERLNEIVRPMETTSRGDTYGLEDYNNCASSDEFCSVAYTAISSDGGNQPNSRSRISRGYNSSSGRAELGMFTFKAKTSGRVSLVTPTGTPEVYIPYNNQGSYQKGALVKLTDFDQEDFVPVGDIDIASAISFDDTASAPSPTPTPTIPVAIVPLVVSIVDGGASDRPITSVAEVKAYTYSNNSCDSGGSVLATGVRDQRQTHQFTLAIPQSNRDGYCLVIGNQPSSVLADHNGPYKSIVDGQAEGFTSSVITNADCPTENTSCTIYYHKTCDMNDDGNINTLDISSAIAALGGLTPAPVWKFDCKKDGVFDLQDFNQLKRRLLQ